jgi:NADH:ubiquinone oxidoreductase subunit E
MHIIKVCQAGSCRRNFAEDSLKRAEKVLQIKAGESTPDGQFRLETCGCLSNCDDGPNVFIQSQGSPLMNIMGNGTIENHMRPDALEAKIKALQTPNP